MIVPRGDEVEVLDAEGAVLIGPEGRRRTISSERELVSGGSGPYRLVAPDDRTLALTPG